MAKTFRERAEELVAQMTLEEKVSQTLHGAAEIERLGIPKYNWWNEALHGIARTGTATLFPQAIGLAASFDEELVAEMADIIATEGRAKYNMHVKYGDRDIYKGLTYWAPNVNISVIRAGEEVMKRMVRIPILHHAWACGLFRHFREMILYI